MDRKEISMKRKWNWVDSVVIALVLIVVVALLNRDKLFGGAEVVNSNKTELIITTEASGLREDMLTNLKVGDQIFSQYRLQNAFVKDIEIMPKQETTVGQDGKIKVFNSKDEITIRVDIEGEAATSGPYMELGGQQIKIGLPIIVKTTEVEFLGDIKHIEVK